MNNEIIKVPVKAQQEIDNFSPEQDIARGQKAAKALMQVIEITKPLKLGGKTYLYAEHWITIARFFKTTAGIEWTRKTETGWEAKAVVYQNGVIIGSAEAACDKDEKNWIGKPSFQLKSMAQTRAVSKALRFIFGWIPVLVGLSATPAEELDNGQYSGYEPNLPPSEANIAPQAIKKPSTAQLKYINSLVEQKQISKDELAQLSEGRTASELIKVLLAFQRSDEAPLPEIQTTLT